MLAISLYNPWAWFVAKGYKKIETRSWQPPGRLVLAGERIAIHAAKSWTRQIRDACRLRGIHEHLPAAVLDDLYKGPELLGNGFLLATCKIVAVLETGRICVGPHALGQSPSMVISQQEAALGDYTPGRFAWVLDDVRELKPWVPCSGRQGFFNVRFQQAGES